MAFYAAGWRRRGAPAADRPRRPARPRARRPARRARRRCPRRRRSGASAPRAGGPCAGPARAPRAPHAPACARGSTACPTLSPYLSLTCSSLRARLHRPPQHDCALTSCSARVCASHASAHACRSTPHPQHGSFVQQSVCKRSEHACAHCWSSRAARWRNTARVEASRVRPSLLAAPAYPAPVLPRTISAGPCRLCSYFTCMAQVRNC